MATWQCSNATQHSRLDQSADDERLLQFWAEQVVKFMRHFGFEFDRCMDVVSAKACLFGADDVLEHRESLFGFAGLNEESWAFRCSHHGERERGGRNRTQPQHPTPTGVDIPASGTVGGDDVVDDIGQEDAAYREELIGKGRQTADIGRRLRPGRTYICLIRECVWLFPRDCAAWKQLETGPPCALPLNTAMGVPVHTGQILVIWR